MQITPKTMRLKRARLHGDPAWLWTAPNGTPFYLCRVLHSTKWVWYRSEHDAISSQMFETLDELKKDLAQAFSSED